jgi:hypothetical protein
MTAVEWLESKFNEFETLDYSLPSSLYEYVNKAKEMEIEQIIDCGNRCAVKQVIHNRRLDLMNLIQLEEFSKEENITFGEEYYNETFKNKL